MWDEFSEATADLTRKIEIFTDNYNQLTPYITKIGTPEDAPIMRQELRQLSRIAEDAAREIREDIKNLYQLITTCQRSEEEKREYRLQAGRLLDEFLSKLVQFQHKQREITDFERNSSLIRARTARLSLRAQRSCDERPTSFMLSLARQRNSFAGAGLLQDEDVIARNGFTRRLSSFITPVAEQQLLDSSNDNNNNKSKINDRKLEKETTSTSSSTDV